MSPQRSSFNIKYLPHEIYKVFNGDFPDNILTNKSTFEDFKKRYRILCLKYHPDKNKDINSLEKMKIINESFSKIKTFYNNKIDFIIIKNLNNKCLQQLMKFIKK